MLCLIGEFETGVQWSRVSDPEDTEQKLKEEMMGNLGGHLPGTLWGRFSSSKHILSSWSVPRENIVSFLLFKGIDKQVRHFLIA